MVPGQGLRTPDRRPVLAEGVAGFAAGDVEKRCLISRLDGGTGPVAPSTA